MTPIVSFLRRRRFRPAEFGRYPCFLQILKTLSRTSWLIRPLPFSVLETVAMEQLASLAISLIEVMRLGGCLAIVLNLLVDLWFCAMEKGRKDFMQIQSQFLSVGKLACWKAIFQSIQAVFVLSGQFPDLCRQGCSLPEGPQRDYTAQSEPFYSVFAGSDY